jgi:hypothetical protein
MFGTRSEFYLPVVVLEGKLFEASISEEDIELHERKHVQLRTFHREEIYVIDFVTKDYFGIFLDEVERTHLEIVAAIRHLKLSSHFKRAAWSGFDELMASTPHPSILMNLGEEKRRAGRVRTKR